MCGITGIFSYASGGKPVDQNELSAISSHMANRGPDGSGLWVHKSRRIGLAHRRLSIIDLSDGGAQPMHTPDGRFSIVYNGELYNYQELRRNLQAAGYAFRSTSDTEVLLYAYREYGRSCVDKLRGMYAFAIWDDVQQGLFMARDPLGIKPLYYAQVNGTLYFASQVKALLTVTAIPRDPDSAGHVSFFAWGNIPQPLTLYKSIRSFEAGVAYWFGSDGKKEQKIFFDLAKMCVPGNTGAGDARPADKHEYLHAVLIDSVKHHLIADVPVGIFQSAGIDSSIVSSLARQCTQSRIRTLTLGFKEYEQTINDETVLAAQISRQFGMDHTERWFDKREFTEDKENILQAMDQPTIDGVNTFLICKMAAEAGLKVVMSGLGGDELFCGYSNYREIPAMVNVLKPFSAIPLLGRMVRQLCAPIFTRGVHYKYPGFLELGTSYSSAYHLRRGLFMPWELPALFDREVLIEADNTLRELGSIESVLKTIQNPLLKIMYLEMTLYMRNRLLVDSDWASMAHSVELRVPFVDAEVLKAVLTLFAARHPYCKPDFASMPALQLPSVLFTRPKTGFNVPVQQWLVDSKKIKQRSRYTLKNWACQVYAHQAGTSGRQLCRLPSTVVE